jgi:hypothetical protein
MCKLSVYSLLDVVEISVAVVIVVVEKVDALNENR